MDLREKILAAKDYKSEPDTWSGVDIELRELSAKERLDFLRDTKAETGKPDLLKVYALLVVFGVYDPATGEHVFTLDDEGAILAKPHGDVEKIANKIAKLRGLDPESQKGQGKNC